MNKIIAILLLQLTVMVAFAQTAPVTLQQVWVTDTTLRTPESAHYDPIKDIIYVANINSISKDPKVKDGDGFISIVKIDGKIENLKWVSSLNDPKGMAAYKGKLYVSDIDQVVEIDIETGTVIKKYDVPGAVFLNDVATTINGDVLITDSGANKAYKLVNGKVSLWLDNADLNKPNGLYVEGTTIFLASMNSGIVRKVDPTTNKLSPWVEGVPSVDGIASDGRGNYYFSNWNGQIYYSNAKGGVAIKLLDTTEKKINSADIDYAEKHSYLLVPTFFKNTLVAYKVVKAKKAK